MNFFFNSENDNHLILIFVCSRFAHNILKPTKYIWIHKSCVLRAVQTIRYLHSRLSEAEAALAHSLLSRTKSFDDIVSEFGETAPYALALLAKVYRYAHRQWFLAAFFILNRGTCSAILWGVTVGGNVNMMQGIFFVAGKLRGVPRP